MSSQALHLDNMQAVLEQHDSLRILALATQGPGGDDENRLRALLSGFPQVDWFTIDRSRKAGSCLDLMKLLSKRSYDLVVMEGTGLAGGLALIVSKLLFDTRYAVSSGDAVAPFFAAYNRLLGIPGEIYERQLCARAAGFIGWTPYLAGRALTFGSRRAMTAAGWAPFTLTNSELAIARNEIRRKHNIPADALVVGIAGSLAWNNRYQYCYGAELAHALRKTARQDAYALIVGDGSGRGQLQSIAGNLAGKRIIFTGRVARHEVPRYLAAMDVASLPQSVDGVGSFRYTTKLPEYVAANVPVVTGEIPLAYDLPRGWFYQLPGSTPWSSEYTSALARFLDNTSVDELRQKAAAMEPLPVQFSRLDQIERVTCFLNDLANQGKEVAR